MAGVATKQGWCSGPTGRDDDHAGATIDSLAQLPEHVAGVRPPPTFLNAAVTNDEV